jgi:hypothetical protein
MNILYNIRQVRNWLFIIHVFGLIVVAYSNNVEYIGPQPLYIFSINEDDQNNVYITGNDVFSTTNTFFTCSAWIYQNNTWSLLLEKRDQNFVYKAMNSSEHYYLDFNNLFRTTDAGLNYTTLSQELDSFDFIDQRIIGINLDNKVYISDDHGDSWSSTTVTHTSTTLHNISVDGSNVLVTGDEGEIIGPREDRAFFSNDNGNSWKAINLPYVGVEQGISMDIQNGVIYLVISDSMGPIHGFYISMDKGASWALQSIDILDPTDFIPYAPFIVVADYNKVFIADKNEFAWRDLGISLPQNLDFKCIAIKGHDLLIGTQRGVYRYTFPNSASCWGLYF